MIVGGNRMRGEGGIQMFGGTGWGGGGRILGKVCGNGWG